MSNGSNKGKAFSFGGGLLKTRLHGLEQDLFIVSGDKLENLQDSSFEFQLFLSLFTLCIGGTLSSLSSLDNNLSRVIFYCSTVLGVVFASLFWRAYRKVGRIKRGFAVKIDGLQIWKATYGSEEKTVDITDKLAALVKDNTLRVSASNEIAGDPHKGVVKALRIEYLVDGEHRTKSAKEGEEVVLP